jgi:hypothetical protein
LAPARAKIDHPPPLKIGQQASNAPNKALRVAICAAGTDLIGNPESDPQPDKSTRAAKQQRRVGERAFTPKLGDQSPDRRANQDSDPNSRA